MTNWFLPSEQCLVGTPSIASLPVPDSIIAALEALLAIASPDDLRAVLGEWQPVLCSQATLITLCLTSASERAKGDAESGGDLQDFLVMLEYTRKHGAEAAMRVVMAMSEADSPDSVSETEEEISTIPPLRFIELLTQSLDCVSQEEHPLVWAQLHLKLGDAQRMADNFTEALEEFTIVLNACSYESMPDGWFDARSKRGLGYLAVGEEDPVKYLALAIADFDACLEKRPEREHDPIVWANLHRFRGVSHSDSYMYTNDKRHIEQAISDLNAALEVLSREETPYEWALAHTNRADAYKERSLKDQAQNIELALADFNTALEIFTLTETTEDWADTHLNRGLAYTERMYGEYAQNIEQAISDLNKVLQVYTRENNSFKYALVYLNLAYAYTERALENRTENLTMALSYANVALELITREANPLVWAAAHMTRGHARMNYPLGEQTNNLEQAIWDFDAALTVYTRESRPIDWAKAALNRVLAYSGLVKTYHRENLDNAINDYSAVLEVFTREETPRYWAVTRMNRGIAHLNRSMGSEAENIEKAIEDFNAALSVFERETTFQNWVMAHIDRGLAYTRRVQGNPAENMDLAINDYDAVLAVISREQMPYYWGLTCKNRAAAYLDRVNGDPAENLRQVYADCKAGLAVFAKETAPREYRDFHLMLSQVYERQGRWEEACVAIREARLTIQMLIEEAATEERRREIMGERDKPSIHLRYARALLRCTPPHVAEAACALEEGRAQNVRNALALDEINPRHIDDSAVRARAETFVAARDAWRAAQNLVTDTAFIDSTATERATGYQQRRPQLNQAHAAFLRARDAIRLADDPNFLAPDVTLEAIGRAIPKPGMALVYLAAAEEDGLALIVMRTAAAKIQVEHLSLPKLTRKAIIKLMLSVDEPTSMKLMQVIGGIQEVMFLTGGLWLAQISHSFEMCTMWGQDLQSAMRALPIDSSFLEAARQLLAGGRLDDEQRAQLKRPFDLMDVKQRLAIGAIYSNLVLNLELKHALPELAALGLNDVADFLQKQQMQDVTFIPYGYLGYFPLPAVPIQQPGGTTKTLSDLFAVTLVPGASIKAMSLARASALDRAARPVLLTVGNPYPLPEGIGDLPYAQAEADTVRRIAEAYRYQAGSVQYLSRQRATKEQVVAMLDKAWYAHLAIHGQYDISAPRQSRLILAGSDALLKDKRNLYLSEALDGMVNLQGMRLLVLSACETGIIDSSYAPDEALGLSAGFLQAGAAGVIASLWAVDDQATYLLMSRFDQLYLNPRSQLSPSNALAAAQRWLREDATNRILMTYDPIREIRTAGLAASSQSAVSPPETEPVVTGSLRSGLRSLRSSHENSLAQVHDQSATRAIREPDALPYADPVYWAGFVVSGC